MNLTRLQSTRHSLSQSSSLTRKLKWMFFLINVTSSVFRSSVLSASSRLSSLVSIAPLVSHLTGNKNEVKITTRSRYWSRSFSAISGENLRIPTTTQVSHVHTLPKPFVWFYDYWLLQQSKGNYRWTTHANFKVMFLVCVDRKGFYNVIGVSKFYQRWTTASTLIMNLSFFNASLYAFTHKLFIEESFSFNWNNSYLGYKLFKYNSQLFYFKDSFYGNETRLSYLTFSHFPVDAALVSDVKSHEKNSFYLIRGNYFTIGLVPGGYDPWMFSFPIPLLSESLLGQYYFLHSLVRLSRLAQLARFEKISRSWSSLKLRLRSS